AFLDNGTGGFLIVLTGEEIHLQHAFANVIGVGASLNGSRSFHWDFRNECSVNDGFRQVVALPSPILHMNSGSLPFRKVGRKNAPEELRKLRWFGALHIPFQDRGVPQGVKIGREGVVLRLGPATEIAHGYTVATLIVVGSGVERHVEVTDKVDDVAHGVGAEPGIVVLVL